MEEDDDDRFLLPPPSAGTSKLLEEEKIRRKQQLQREEEERRRNKKKDNNGAGLSRCRVVWMAITVAGGGEMQFFRAFYIVLNLNLDKSFCRLRLLGNSLLCAASLLPIRGD